MACAWRLARSLFSRIRGRRLRNHAGHSNLVCKYLKAQFHAAESGLRTGMDHTLRTDGNCSVAHLADARLARSHPRPGSLLGATTSELRLELDLLSSAPDFRRSRG